MNNKLEDLTDKIDSLGCSDKLLELPISKKFIYRSNIVKVVKRKNNNYNCIFNKPNARACSACLHLACSNNERKYNTDVYFKKIK